MVWLDLSCCNLFSEQGIKSPSHYNFRDWLSISCPQVSMCLKKNIQVTHNPLSTHPKTCHEEHTLSMNVLPEDKAQVKVYVTGKWTDGSTNEWVLMSSCHYESELSSKEGLPEKCDYWADEQTDRYQTKLFLDFLGRGIIKTTLRERACLVTP